MKIRAPLGVLAFALAGCASTPPEEPASTALEKSIQALAGDLVESAKLRTDVRTVRALQRPIQAEEDPTASRSGLAVQGPFSPNAEQHIEDVLSRELVLALSDQMHLIETQEEIVVPVGEDLRETALRYGATHVLLGEHDWDGRTRDGTVAVTLRLVDARSRVIIAAVRGTVPTTSLLRGLTPTREVRKLVAVPEQNYTTLPPIQRSTPSRSTTTSSAPLSSQTWRTKELAELLGIEQPK